MALLDILLDRSGAIGGRIRSERLKAGRDSSLQKRPPTPTRTVIIAATGEKLIFDATTDIQHTFSSEVTSYPVEDKGTVSDHVVNTNPRFTISGVFSDAAFNIDSVPNLYPQYRVYQILLKMYEDRKTVTLLTTLDTFDNLIITNLSLPRTSGQGRALFIDVEFEKVRRVSNELTTVFVGSNSTKVNGDAVKNTTGDIKNNGAANKDASNKEAKTKAESKEGIASKTILSDNTSTPLVIGGSGGTSTSGNNIILGGEIAE